MMRRQMRAPQTRAVLGRAAGSVAAALCLVAGGLALAEPASAATASVSSQATQNDFTVNGPVVFNVGETAVIGGRGVPGARVYLDFMSDSGEAYTTVNADGTWQMSFIFGPDEYKAGQAVAKQFVNGEPQGGTQFFELIARQPSSEITFDGEPGVKVVHAGSSTTVTGTARPDSVLRVRLMDDWGDLTAPVQVSHDGRWSATIHDPGFGYVVFVEYIDGGSGYASFDLLRYP